MKLNKLKIHVYNEEDVAKVKQLVEVFFKKPHTIETHVELENNYINIITFRKVFALSKMIEKYCCGVRRVEYLELDPVEERVRINLAGGFIHP